MLPPTAALHSEKPARRLPQNPARGPRYDLALLGYVVMPEHIHLLISEPNVGTPSTVMQALKQRVSRLLRNRTRHPSASQLRLWNDESLLRHPRFWQRRFYDFNVWSFRKKNEKLNYMHFNPVRRGLVEHPNSGCEPKTRRTVRETGEQCGTPGTMTEP
ncbi:MAG TPA: transposase [Candidatus Acidoferrales bacterium]|nr:transposase [Candidatus Acidoferrales bacterium]